MKNAWEIFYIVLPKEYSERLSKSNYISGANNTKTVSFFYKEEAEKLARELASYSGVEFEVRLVKIQVIN